jgi:AraC-like DNA-binding protein
MSDHPFAYAELRPPALAGAADLLWCYRGPTAFRRKRILPNGRVELIVNLAQPYRVLEGGGQEILRTAWVGGLYEGPAVIGQPSYQDVLGIRLDPLAAAALLGMPMGEIGGRQVDLQALVGSSAADELVARCAEAESDQARMSVLAAWIAERLARAGALDAALTWAAASVEKSGGLVPIAELRERTGLSKTALVRTFREHLGVTPKVYARIVRFRGVVAALQKGGGSLTGVALDAGYYDQAHMNGEFRALAGITPGEFVALRHPVGDGTTLAVRRGPG